jgi:DNA-binding SARP family transcriptional activator
VALLGLLLINANRAVSVDSLVDALWGASDRMSALKRLRVAVVRLRRTLDVEGGPGASALRTVGGGYLLTVEPDELDSSVFERRVEEGRRALETGDARRGREVLDEALAIGCGGALAEVAYQEFAQPEIRRLEELRLGALEARIEAADLRLGDHAGLIGELEGLVAAYPGRERLAGQLMVALYRCERQGEALDV